MAQRSGSDDLVDAAELFRNWCGRVRDDLVFSRVESNAHCREHQLTAPLPSQLHDDVQKLGELLVWENNRGTQSVKLPVDADGWPIKELVLVLAQVNRSVYGFDLVGPRSNDPFVLRRLQGSDQYHDASSSLEDMHSRKLGFTVRIDTAGAMQYRTPGSRPRQLGVGVVYPVWTNLVIRSEDVEPCQVLSGWIHGPPFI